jgi:hypothetical protein
VHRPSNGGEASVRALWEARLDAGTWQVRETYFSTGETEMNQDTEHLKLLSIFHYVVGGLTAIFACVPLIHFFVGLGLATGAFDDTPGEARMMGGFLMVFAGGFILAGWALAVAIAIAGRNLARRTRYTYCMVVAGIECILMPFGTVLGVFTIIVLMRDSVKALFEGGSSPTIEPSDTAA